MKDYEEKYKGTPIVQSMSAKIQLGLMNTAGKLSNKIRYIDKIAPRLVEGGVVRKCNKLSPFTIQATGISTAHRLVNSMGSILYGAAAVRQDIFIKEGSIYKTRQESIVDVDEIDYMDTNKRLKYYDIINTYTLLGELMEEENRPELIVLDIPLMLERGDVPLENRYSAINDFNKCKEVIEDFWLKYKADIYPFNTEGIKIVSVGRKKFGAVLLAIAEGKGEYILDKIEDNVEDLLIENYDKIRKINIQMILKGILGPLRRTAAFQTDSINEVNRFEPVSLRELGIIGYHFKAGMRTEHILVETMGNIEDWSSEMIDQLTSQLISLMIYDQPKTLPLPLWYAKHGLEPLRKRPGLLEFYKRQVKQIIKNQNLETQWLEGEDLFDESDLL